MERKTMHTQAMNHPKKDSHIVIEPLRTLEEVQRVKDVLKEHPRNYALWSLAVNTNLRASDLLALCNADIDWKRHEIRLKEKKTGKKRHIAVSPKIIRLLEGIRVEDDENALLFRSEKTGGQIRVDTFSSMVKEWCRRAGLSGGYAAHSTRKTWAYIQYKVFGTDIELISQELNHANMRTTYRYLGIMPDDVKRLYLREI